MIKSQILLSLLIIPFFVGCGGSGTETTDTEFAKITGTVPGTKIEAFCDDSIYKKVESFKNGTDKHPFILEIPTNTNCRLVMTTNEENSNSQNL